MCEDKICFASCPKCGRTLFTADLVNNYQTICPDCKTPVEIRIIDEEVTVKRIPRLTVPRIKRSAEN